LGPVSLIGDSSTITENSDCPGTYGVQVFTGMSADLSIKSYNLTFTVSTCGGIYPTLAGVWIDYNRNFVFESNEQLGAFTTSKGAVTIQFQPPESAVEGSTRMRIQVQETYQTYIRPCDAFAYGGTKDFTVVIKNNAYCICGPTELGVSVLGSVALIGDTSNIRNTIGCPGALGPVDFTSESANVKISSAYTLTYDVLACNGSQKFVVSAAWIDYNRNLQFEDWEQIAVENTQYGTINALFKVPVSTSTRPVVLGKTRLRVQVQEVDTMQIDPCLQFRFGGTKDFLTRDTKN